jgi:large subunit ribosomal protein L29
MKAQEVKDLDVHELKSQAQEIQEQLFRLRFQMSMGHTDGLKKVRNLKKDLARVYTEQRARELAAQPSKAVTGKGGNTGGAVTKG